ncbi:MAG: hypothetical protein QM478_12115 [Flavobacteriaceae bacterium]
MVLSKLEIFEHNFTKIIVAIIVLISIGIFNINRIKAKRKLNNTIKTLDYKSIKIDNSVKSITYNTKNTKGFDFTVTPINDEIFEAKLFLIDKEDNQYQILGFDEMNEQYANDDLNWFANYFTNHLRNKEVN